MITIKGDKSDIDIIKNHFHKYIYSESEHLVCLMLKEERMQYKPKEIIQQTQIGFNGVEYGIWIDENNSSHYEPIFSQEWIDIVQQIKEATASMEKIND